MSDFFYKISSFTSFIMIILLNVIYIAINDFQINGVFLLLFLAMLLNPILNYVKINKRIILNPIYNLLVSVTNIYILYISFNCIKLGINSYTKILGYHERNINYINNAREYLNNNLLYMLIAIIFILLISLLFKKNKEEEMLDNKILAYIVINCILIELFFKLFSYNLHIIPEASNICILLWFVFKNKLFDKMSETNYFLILFVLNVFSINPVGIVITFFIYFQYRKGLLGYSGDLD